MALGIVNIINMNVQYYQQVSFDTVKDTLALILLTSNTFTLLFLPFSETSQEVLICNFRLCCVCFNVQN